jgi:hypothetical protein
MSRQHVERMREVYNAFARRDLEAMTALAEKYPPAPGFEFESALTGQVYRGVEGALDLLRAVIHRPSRRGSARSQRANAPPSTPSGTNQRRRRAHRAPRRLASSFSANGTSRYRSIVIASTSHKTPSTSFNDRAGQLPQRHGGRDAGPDKAGDVDYEPAPLEAPEPRKIASAPALPSKASTSPKQAVRASTDATPSPSRPGSRAAPAVSGSWDRPPRRPRRLQVSTPVESSRLVQWRRRALASTARRGGS